MSSTHLVHVGVRRAALAALAVFVLPLPFVRAQSATPADRAWESVRTAARACEVTAGDEPTDLTTVNSRRAARYRAAADEARGFAVRFAGDPKIAEAKRLEALMLIHAVQFGEASLEERMTAAVRDVCGDRSVSEAVRAEVTGTHRFLEVLRRTAEPKEVAAAFEKIARDLIREFPRQPQGYESLLTSARGSDDQKARQLANELLALPAPEAVKQSSRVLLARLDLVGQPLARVLADGPDRKAWSGPPSGRRTLIYTWATWSPGSIALGEMLAKRKLGSIDLLGLNLDQNVDTAQRTAETHPLPGKHVFDANGSSGALARRLGADAAPLVYFVDAQGVIRDVRGLDQLEEKLAQLGL